MSAPWVFLPPSAPLPPLGASSARAKTVSVGRPCGEASSHGSTHAGATHRLAITPQHRRVMSVFQQYFPKLEKVSSRKRTYVIVKTLYLILYRNNSRTPIKTAEKKLEKVLTKTRKSITINESDKFGLWVFPKEKNPLKVSHHRVKGFFKCPLRIIVQTIAHVNT